MHSRKQLSLVIDQVLASEEEIEPSTMDDYNKLNVKCDIVIKKIKSRKGKKNIQQNSGE